ncbi:MAG: hypothetical protein P4L53_09175 [Candidatus Obscuribacterales bacterium]|nr:hypothetical protein [Candidatus Obscuribacterales bacterium]
MTSIGNQDKFLGLHCDGRVVACPCCHHHGVNVLEDGSRRCVLTGEAFEATEADGDLFSIRQGYEKKIHELASRSGYSWQTIVAMPQPERQTLATSFAFVDLFHKNCGGNPAVTTVAILPAETLEPTIVEGAVSLLVERGWEVFPARSESNCDQRTLWLKAPAPKS